eukprot:226357_1
MSKGLIVIAFVAMAAIFERGFVSPFGLSTIGDHRVGSRMGWIRELNFQMVSSQAESKGKVFVSGFLDSKERTDQLVFDVLKAQGRWDTIVAFAQDAAFAKKRLVSRQSRYSGLSDLLEFEEGDVYNRETMLKKLKGCDSWLCFNCNPAKIKQQAEVAKEVGVKKLVIASVMPAEQAECLPFFDTVYSGGNTIDVTLMRMGEIVEGEEYGNIMIGPMEATCAIEKASRSEAVRAAAECLVIDGSSNIGFSFGGGDEISDEWLKLQRTRGVSRRDELNLLLKGGMVEYRVHRKVEEEYKRIEASKSEEEKKADLQAIRDLEDKIEDENKENAHKPFLDKREANAQVECDKILKNEFEGLKWRLLMNVTFEEFLEWPGMRERALACAHKRIDINSGFRDYDANDPLHKFITHEEDDDVDPFMSLAEQEREREDVDCVARTRFALNLNDEERKTLEGAKKEAEAHWEERMELVGQMAAYAERRKEIMAPVVHQVFEDGQLTLEELMKGQEKEQKLSNVEAA